MQLVIDLGTHIIMILLTYGHKSSTEVASEVSQAESVYTKKSFWTVWNVMKVGLLLDLYHIWKLNLVINKCLESKNNCSWSMAMVLAGLSH